MPHVLRLANASGSVVQYLTPNASTDPHLMQYVPAAPELSTVDFTPETLRDGGERFLTTRRNVTESAVIRVVGATEADVRGVIQNIEKIFKRVDEWHRFGVGEPYYVQFTPSGYAAPHLLWRSELLSGRLDLGAAAIDTDWWNRLVECQVTWTRRYYWEDPTSATVTITNSSSASTQPVLITNNPALANWVDITGSTVTGSLPTPALMTIESNTPSVNIGSIYVGLNTWGTPSTLPHWIQAELTTELGTATIIDPATGSSGNKNLQVVLPVAEGILGKWTLSPTMVKEGGGRYFRLLARFATVSAGGIGGLPMTGANAPPFAFRPKLALQGTGSVLWTGPEVIVLADYAIRDLGVIQLPPANLPFTEAFSLAPMQLQLFGRSLGTATKAVRIDGFQVTPLDSYRTYEMAADGLGSGRQLVDEPSKGFMYQQDAGTGDNRSNVFAPGGSPLWLWPGQNARAVFLNVLTDRTAPTGSEMKIGLSHRPRRLTI